MSSPFDRLQSLFAKFPGIGNRQARRFAFFLAKQPKSFHQELIREIQQMSSCMYQCARSLQFFYSTTPEKHSPFERDSLRKRNMVMIVEKDLDIEVIEKSNSYQGLYFVLGFPLSLLQNPSSHPSLELFIQQIPERITSDGLQEIILAFSYTPESEHTYLYIKQILTPLCIQHHITLTTLGRGLSLGSELEYTDPDTFRHALHTRT